MDISIVMPVYNGESYLKEALESLLIQTLSNFELIIIDDGSTDKSAEIIKSYNDSRIFFYQNEANLGLIKTLNKGLACCSGSYIARMDADDISHPKRLQIQFSFMQKHPEVGICGTRYIKIRDGKRKHPRLHSYISQPDWVLRVNMLKNSAIAHPSYMIRKSVLTKHDIFYNEKYVYAEDYDFLDRIMQVSQAHVIGRPLLYYRNHEEQVSNVYANTQEKNADIIRHRGIRRLVPDSQNKQLIIHQALMKGGTFCSMAIEERAITTWCYYILQENKIKTVFDNKYFKYFINKQKKCLLRKLKH